MIRSLAPLGADRFHALIQDNFFTQAALFRVVPGFVLQFGISGEPDIPPVMLENSLSLTLSFAVFFSIYALL